MAQRRGQGHRGEMSNIVRASVLCECSLGVEIPGPGAEQSTLTYAASHTPHSSHYSSNQFIILAGYNASQCGVETCRCWLEIHCCEAGSGCDTEHYPALGKATAMKAPGWTCRHMCNAWVLERALTCVSHHCAQDARHPAAGHSGKGAAGGGLSLERDNPVKGNGAAPQARRYAGLVAPYKGPNNGRLSQDTSSFGTGLASPYTL